MRSSQSEITAPPSWIESSRVHFAKNRPGLVPSASEDQLSAVARTFVAAATSAAKAL